LGILDHKAVTNATAQSKKKTSYQKWTASEKFEIGKYAAQNGHAAAERKFEKKKSR